MFHQNINHTLKHSFPTSTPEVIIRDTPSVDSSVEMKCTKDNEGPESTAGCYRGPVPEHYSLAKNVPPHQKHTQQFSREPRAAWRVRRKQSQAAQMRTRMNWCPSARDQQEYCMQYFCWSLTAGHQFLRALWQEDLSVVRQSTHNLLGSPPSPQTRLFLQLGG